MEKEKETKINEIKQSNEIIAQKAKEALTQFLKEDLKD